MFYCVDKLLSLMLSSSFMGATKPANNIQTNTVYSPVISFCAAKTCLTTRHDFVTKTHCINLTCFRKLGRQSELKIDRLSTILASR